MLLFAILSRTQIPGPEFQHTDLLLSQTPNPILTCDLVYTGITRTRDWLTLIEAKRGIWNDA
ncbi:hypothetical protein ACFIOZ_14625 [Vreelandella sp. F11]|uniref:hypothetical protein n=1 Tax=Vreelandella sp. F11 TaxID=3394751 RepID=UPI0036DDDE32